jgi:hypothetical protein
MKVMCITLGPMFDKPETDWKICFGEEYEVIGEHTRGEWKFYELSHHLGVAYAIEHFVVLPDEKEINDAMHLEDADRLLQLCADMMPEVEMPQRAFDRVWKGIEKSFA